MVSEPRHETTQVRPAKAIRIPGVLCYAPGVKTKILSTKNKRPGCKQRSRSHGESAEVFLLDILSQRMSDMTIYRKHGTAYPHPLRFITFASQLSVHGVISNITPAPLDAPPKEAP